MDSTHSFEVPPDPSLMEDIGATSFTVAEAIVELVANSLDARIDEDSAIDVHVSISKDHIHVVDNASGMDLETLKDAVRLGVKMDAIKGAKKRRKGMFGLGMKTAAASLGRVWEVATRPVEDDVEYAVRFDLESYAKRRGEDQFDWKIEIAEGEPDRDGPLGERPHGTAIVVTRLRERDPMHGRVLELLGSAYRPHIDAGDCFFVNGTEARPPVYDFVDGSRQAFEVSAGDEYVITGWVALDKHTHNAGDYGLNLYREDQLIESWNKEWFRAHLMTSRIVGEAHLDFVPVNFYKQGFETQSPEWKIAGAAMKEFLKPVVKASREMSRGKNTTKYAKAVEGLNRAMGKAPAIGVVDVDEAGSGRAQEEAPGPDVGVDAKTLSLSDGPLHLAHSVEDFSSELTPWDYLYDEGAHELVAVLNANSRLFSQVKDEKFLGTLAIADCVTRFLMEVKDFPASRAREIRDRWLFVALGDEG